MPPFFRVHAYSSFLNLYLSFHVKFPLFPQLPFQPCEMNNLSVALGAWVRVVWSQIGDGDEGPLTGEQ